MASLLDPWERRFSEEIKSCLSRTSGNHAGALLSAIPARSEWEDFCNAIKADWPKWMNFNPACLVMLFCGLAFFEYEDGRFWPEFSHTLGIQYIPSNKQTEINQQFAHCAKYFGIKLRCNATSTDYVGSAIYYTGIPLIVWSEFLVICRWALWNPEWEHASSETWNTNIDIRCGGHKRLKRFLVDNRELATTFIREMISLRTRLAHETINSQNELFQNSFIRREYREEVPETAEFLFPGSPEHVIRDRISIAFDKIRRDIYLRVPAVSQTNAVWKVGQITSPASMYPDKISLNSTAFKPHISVTLTSSSGEPDDRRLIPGLIPWAIFDLDDDGAMVNRKRESLPTRRYVLLSRTRIDKIERKGFYEEDFPPNDPFELSDGTECFITELEPRDERASIRFCSGEDSPVTIKFRPRERIEYHFLPAHGPNLACCRREKDIFITRYLPTICISVPSNFFGSAVTIEELKRKFRIKIIDQPTHGKWRQFLVNGSDREYYLWEWDSDRPIMYKRSSSTMVYNDLSDLKSKCFEIPELRGELQISIESSEFCRDWKINKESQHLGAENAWKSLPGDFLPMILLSQCSNGMTWDELLLARNAISPGCRIDRTTLYKYQAYGFVEQSGARWCISHSRMMVQKPSKETLKVDYCGDSGKLWGLYSYLNDLKWASLLPRVEVVAGEGSLPPFLRIIWPIRMLEQVETYLRENGVEIREDIWTL